MSLKKCGKCDHYKPSRDDFTLIGCRLGYWSAPGGWGFDYDVADERARNAQKSCGKEKPLRVGRRPYWD